MNMVQKCHSVMWAKAHLKWTVSKWKHFLWSDESKFDILPACYQNSVQKPLIVWGCISAYGMGSLHVLEGTMNAERYIKVFYSGFCTSVLYILFYKSLPLKHFFQPFFTR